MVEGLNWKKKRKKNAILDIYDNDPFKYCADITLNLYEEVNSQLWDEAFKLNASKYILQFLMWEF